MGAIEQVFAGVLWDSLPQLRTQILTPRIVLKKEKTEEKKDVQVPWEDLYPVFFTIHS